LAGLLLSREAFGQISGPGGALANEEARRRIRDERSQRDRSSEGFLAYPTAPRQRVYVDWGGWVDFNYTNFRSLDRRRDLGYEDLRTWVGASLDNSHSVYARIRTVNINWGRGDSFDGRDDDVVEPKVDVLYYNLNIRNALATYYGIDLPMELQMTVGRQFITLGQHWLYFQRNDAVLLEGQAGPFDFKTFAAQSIRQDDNFDQTTPKSSESQRFFYGGQVTYKYIPNHDPYFMWLIQKDQSGDLFKETVVKYDYDSCYLGLGSTGVVIPKFESLKYFAEGVWEGGQSRSVNRLRTLSGTEDIDAWAYDFGLNYYFDHTTKPKVGLEYGHASGDGDRGSVTNTVGGNQIGTSDTGFLGMGFMETGYSFAPLFSNLQFLKYDASFKPLSCLQNKGLKNMTLGSAVYHYWKDDASGLMSDARSDTTSKDLGQELDFFADWQVASDLRLTVQYGIFYPGQSLTESKNSDYLSVGILFNF
jgi:hypothetical protein